MPLSLSECIESALKDAAEAHKLCCHGESEWAGFYACFVAKRLAPVLAGIQCAVDKALALKLAEVPVMVVKGKWDKSSFESTSGYGNGKLPSVKYTFPATPSDFDPMRHGR